VFDLITRGQSDKQAARAMGCTERTIKAHRQRVMEKLEVKSSPELVSFADRAGALDAMSGS
jgi:DNA-binding NarL/FixJ family response regulator